MPPKRVQKRTTRRRLLAKAYSTITDLPNEILLMILSLVDGFDLYSLALLCKRLHTIALPIYLARFNISPHYPYLANHNFEGIKGLRIALFITKLQSLEFSIPGTPILSVQRLAERMSSITSARLTTIHEYCDGPKQIKPFKNFMDVLAQKSCEDLAILGSCDWGQETVRNVRIRLFRSLRTVTFKANFLFTASFRKWTIGSLNASQIHSLYLSATAAALADILPHLTLPSLGTFSLECLGLSFTTLTAFLARHESVLTLEIDSPLLLDGPFPVGVLPYLSKIKGGVQLFLHLNSKPNALPKLNVVKISIWDKPPKQFFEGLARTNVSQICLPLENHVYEQLLALPIGKTRLSFARAERKLDRVLSLELDFSAPCDTVAKIPGWLALFPAVTSVSFPGWGFHSWPRQKKTAVAREISVLCPKMKNITFCFTSGTIEEWCSEPAPQSSVRIQLQTY